MSKKSMSDISTVDDPIFCMCSASISSCSFPLSIWGSSACPALFFLFFATGILLELSIFMRGGFLSPPSFEDFWLAFLLGWTIEAMLHDVVLLGVLAGDWVLFSLDTFPCCLYNSVALCNISVLQSTEEGLLSTLFLSWVRCVWIKEVLKPTPSKCTRKMPLGSNPFSLSTYVRFNFLKWATY
jgi:hypothetical protein